MKSPVVRGFQTNQSVVRLIGAMRTSFDDFVAVGRRKRHGRHVFARQRAFDRERDPHRLAGHAERWCVEAQELDVGQASRAADGNGEDGHALESASRAAAWTGGGPSFQSPSDARQRSPQVLEPSAKSPASGSLQVRAVARLGRRERLIDHIHSFAEHCSRPPIP